MSGAAVLAAAACCWLLRFPDFSHASIPTVIRALQKFVEPAQGSARDR